MCGGMASCSIFGVLAAAAKYSTCFNLVYPTDIILKLLPHLIHQMSIQSLQVYRRVPFGHHYYLIFIFACFQVYQDITLWLVMQMIIPF